MTEQCPDCGNTLKLTEKVPVRGSDGQLRLTQSLLQRFKGMLLFSEPTLHDIRKRDELHTESSLIFTLSLVLIINSRLFPFFIMDQALPHDNWLIYTVVSVVVGNSILLLLLLLMGRQFQRPGPHFSSRSILRTMIYLAPVIVLDNLFLSMAIFTGLRFFTISVIVALVYTYYLAQFVMKQLFHTTEIATVWALTFVTFGWITAEMGIYLFFLSL